MFENLFAALHLNQTGLPETSMILNRLIFLAALAAGYALIDLIINKIVLRIIHKVIRKTATKWDDIVFDSGFFRRLSHIIPAVITYLILQAAFVDAPFWSEVLQRVAIVFIIFLVTRAVVSLLTAVNQIYRAYPISKSRPIKGYIQILKIFVYIVGIILIITTILDTSPVGLLSGIGALSAVILLVFKDSILGLVAGIQLSANEMVQIGDWIEMPEAGADGDVVDITLQHVTVQNWDKTLVNIPIYNLISTGFKNWRGMKESGGRRIKRAVHLDMNSVKFCTPEMIQRFEKIAILRDYLRERTAQVDQFNKDHQVDGNVPANGRKLTNLGTFRAYLTEYLKHHSSIKKDMTMMVRQLPPGPEGLPLEIYAFCSDQNWTGYEGIQADIFDHILAVIPQFDLKVYQKPGSADIQTAAERILNQ